MRRLATVVVVLLVVLGAATHAQATHLRAGDIQAKTDTTANPNPRRIFFKMILYTARLGTVTNVREDNITIFFGDGTSSGKGAIPRTTKDPVPIPSSVDTDINVYYFEHTFNAPGNYTVSYIGENRNTGILNMSQSGEQTFYISTNLTIDPALGINRSPVLTAPAIDKATTNQVFLHNPAAYDADGDSLAFKLLYSQKTSSIDAVIGSRNNTPDPTQVPNYQYPNIRDAPGVQVAYPGAAVGSKAIFDINVYTGLLVWNAPSSQSIGEYNVAIIVEEWRRVQGAPRRRIGVIIRDMQINVKASTNRRPNVVVPPDLCVVAGTNIVQAITGTDPDNNPVQLFAYGTFPPITFRQTSTGPPTASGTFQWSTSCTDVRREPYQFTFKAQDVPGAGETPLIDEKVWQVTVIGPAPQNLQASVTGARALLTWDRYICQGASQILIYRKENSTNFTHGPCQTGIPASLGYTQVGAVAANLNSFADDNNGQGLVRGKTYCYRIYAVFPLPKGGESIASTEACVTLTGRSAVFTNVTVDRTAASGQMTVKWTKPTSSGGFVAPTGYRLYRAAGQNPDAAAFTLITTKSDLNDTTYVDAALNTAGIAYSYRLEFFSNATTSANSAVLTETTGPASSVLLTGTTDAANPGNVLRWTYTVPWDNSVRPTTIYRRDFTGTTFTQVGTVTSTATSGTFTDRGTTANPLRSGQTYCYYVRTDGDYTGVDLPKNLVNLSQELCIRAVPCTPVLTLRPLNCDSLSATASNATGPFPPAGFTYTNNLTWTLDGNNPAGCSQSVAYYRIFFQPTIDAAFTLLDSVRTMSYVHRGLASAAGCYRVQAVDSTSQRSALSNDACNDNCLFFLMPNIFTPNGDGINDTFRPKISSPIRRTHVTIFSRWGVKVYESDQYPLIEWSGSNSRDNSKGPTVSEGVYFYQAEVEFQDFKNTKQTYKGWVQINR